MSIPTMNVHKSGGVGLTIVGARPEGPLSSTNSPTTCHTRGAPDDADGTAIRDEGQDDGEVDGEEVRGTPRRGNTSSEEGRQRAPSHRERQARR
ncbi:hypothetical protein [Streptomyces coeruleorubidus]